MKVITRETVKAYLGITADTYDDQIDRQIPIIDAKVKRICGNNFNLQLTVKLISGSKYVQLFGCGIESRKYWNNWPTAELKQLMEDLPVGSMLEGSGVPSGAYIAEAYYNGISEDNKNIPTFEMNEAATASDSTAYIYAGINTAYQSVIAKGIWWLIGQTSTKINDTSWTSKGVGPLSVTKGNVAEKIDGRSGMPAWFVQALPRFMR